MTKPKIVYCRVIGYWICNGDNVKGYGESPNSAYNRWRVLRDKAEYTKGIWTRIINDTYNKHV